jgi:aspartyl-tRNA(Asn)/glutamyl-tRNA(Gln) amidotransferase subunit A
VSAGGAAADTARRVRAGETSAVATVTDRLAAIGDDPLNAFTLVEADAARTAAGRIDERIAAGGDPGPLAGVTLGVKDLFDHVGRPTTAGSSFLRQPATATAPALQRLLDAGAVLVGRTGLHEFAYGFSSENDWWGPVRNPWDPATSPGGSSGGSAAAVTAGLVHIGLGTDTGGSVRVPAALCGLVGLKVTHGRIPITGVFPLAPSLDTVGPITRTVGDAAAAYAVLAGHDPDDPWSAPQPVDPPLRLTLDGLRIAVPSPWVDRGLDRTQRQGWERFVGDLESRGAVVVPVRHPAIDATAVADGAYAEVGAVHRTWFTEDPGRYGPAIRDRLGAALERTVDELAEALAWRAGLRHVFAEVLAGVDLLATPTVAALRKMIGEATVEARDGAEPYRPALSWFTVLVNQAGLPALALPLGPGHDGDGPPPSVQLIGRWWGENALLGVGLALEEAGVAGFTPPPPLPDSPRPLTRIQ